MSARGDSGGLATRGSEQFVRRLSAEDSSILALENEVVAGHTCKVIILRGEVDVRRLQHSIGSRLERAPSLSMRLGEIDGRPWWIAEPRVNMEAHVVSTVGETCDETGLRVAVARLFEQRLDRCRPLWRIDVIPRLQGEGTALVWRIHHALADGSTAMRMAQAVLWDSDGIRGGAAGRQGAPALPRTRRGTPEHHRLEGLRATVREAPQPWLRSPFSGHIGARRTAAFALVDLVGLRNVARATHGATVNDAVLTVVAGGLRRWLERHHGHLGALRVKVPVNLHGLPPATGGEGAVEGNRDSFFCVDLPLGSSDPLERLATIRRATTVRKEGHDAEHLDALMHQLGRVPSLRQFAEKALAHPRSFALNVSNVPGPRARVRVLHVPVSAIYSLAEIREHHALRIAVTSLGKALSFGLTADPTLVEDVQGLAVAIRAEADDLSARLRFI